MELYARENTARIRQKYDHWEFFAIGGRDANRSGEPGIG